MVVPARRLALGIGLVAGVVAIDQGVKGLVVEKLSPVGSHPLVPGLLDLSLRQNSGVAFSLLHSLPPGAMIALVLVVLGVFLALALPYLRTGGGMAATVLILGGALGNLVDRITRKAVVDYLDVHVWPVFNLADVAIVVGVGLLIVTLLLADRRPSPVPGGEHS